MKKWLYKHRLAISYVIVATIFTGLALLAMHFYPLGVQVLGSYGYEMQSPQYLLLAAAIPLLWFVRLHTLTDIPWLQQMLSTTIRSVMILALALALTRITHVSHEARQVATVMVVDVSESVPDEVLADANARLQKIWDERGENAVKLVTFADKPVVVPLSVDEKGRLAAISRHEKGGLNTDLQQAIRLAYGLYPPGHLKRMVLVTDGNETNGNALAEVATAVRLGISVHHHTLPDIAPKPEVMVQGLDVPDDIEANVPFDVSTQLLANHAGRAKCTLKVDKLVASVREVTLVKGDVDVDFDEVRVREGGEHAFKVECEPVLADGATEEQKRAADRFASNNHFELSRFVPEKKRILYVEGEALYSRNFRDALKDDFKVEVRGARGVPRSLTAMKKYKAIVISDVPRYSALYRENMSYKQMRALHQYAKQGGMLIFTGGHDSLGPGGYAGTYLERQVLPVKLEVENQLETPRLALALVMDRSGSMSGKKLELAKKAARETVGVLSKEDRVGIIAFDSHPNQIIRLTRASAKSRFDRALARLTAGGGTAIYGALEEAFNMLEGVEAQLKHVILLTDGQSNKTGILHLVSRMARKKITISTIAIGAGSDRPLLAAIAQEGQGRHYYTESAEAIPKLFVDETRQVAQDSVVEDRIRAVLTKRFRNLRFLRGINVHRAPVLGGFLPTQAKRKSDVIMRTNGGEPLLVRWKRGKGWVYVFTSDIKNKWGRRWLKWPSFAPFWRQLVKDGIVEKKKDEEFPIEVTATRHQLRISTDAVDKKDQFVAGVTSKATIIDPSGDKREVVLKQSAAGRYEAVLPVSKYGPYRVDVAHAKDGKKLAISRGRATYPYAEEHLKFEPDLTRVAMLSSNTGGRPDPTPASLFEVHGEQLTHRAPAWHWFLYFVLAAYLLDVMLRRVRLWPTRTLGWGKLRDAG